MIDPSSTTTQLLAPSIPIILLRAFPLNNSIVIINPQNDHSSLPLPKSVTHNPPHTHPLTSHRHIIKLLDHIISFSPHCTHPHTTTHLTNCP